MKKIDFSFTIEKTDLNIYVEVENFKEGRPPGQSFPDPGDDPEGDYKAWLQIDEFEMEFNKKLYEIYDADIWEKIIDESKEYSNERWEL